MTVKIFIDQF